MLSMGRMTHCTNIWSQAKNINHGFSHSKRKSLPEQKCLSASKLLSRDHSTLCGIRQKKLFHNGRVLWTVIQHVRSITRDNKISQKVYNIVTTLISYLFSFYFLFKLMRRKEKVEQIATQSAYLFALTMHLSCVCKKIIKYYVYSNYIMSYLHSTFKSTGFAIPCAYNSQSIPSF